MNVTTEAIILKTQKYKEFDEIITVFSKKFGKINMFARSSKKIKSPLLSGTQLFGYVNMEMDLRENGSRLYTSTVIKSYYKFSEDLSKYYLASYICELIEKTQQENQTDLRLFDVILKTFNIMEENKDLNLKLMRLVFEVKLLKSMGIAPVLDSCVICSNNDPNVLKYIDFSQSSVICEDCVRKQQFRHYRMDRNLIRFIKYVYNNNIQRCLDVKIADVLLEQLDEFIQLYLKSYFGKFNINSYKIIKEEESIYDNIRKN